MVRDRFVAVFPLGPIAAGSLGPASALTIAVAIALANHPGEQPKRAEERNGGAHGGPPETSRKGPPAAPKPATDPLLLDDSVEEGAATAPPWAKPIPRSPEDGAEEAPVEAIH